MLQLSRAKPGNPASVVYNSKKSSVLICRNKAMDHAAPPVFTVNGSIIGESDIRWNILVTLFVTICLMMMIWWDKDDNCMLREMFYRGVFICVHLKLRMYYSVLFALDPLYTCQLWSRYTARSLHKLYVAYNNAFRMMHHVHLPTYCSASEMFTVNRVPNCAAVIRNLTFKFMSRLGFIQQCTGLFNYW